MLLCILTIKWVLSTPLTGQNHLFWHFNIFLCREQEKRIESAKEKEKISKIEVYQHFQIKNCPLFLFKEVPYLCK